MKKFLNGFQVKERTLTMKCDLDLHWTGLIYEFCTSSSYGECLSKVFFFFLFFFFLFFKILQSMKDIWSRYEILTDRQTDGQRDDILRPVFRREYRNLSHRKKGSIIGCYENPELSIPVISVPTSPRRIQRWFRGLSRIPLHHWEIHRKFWINLTIFGYRIYSKHSHTLLFPLYLSQNSTLTHLCILENGH